jgi:dihydroxy-acid dehydratase
VTEFADSTAKDGLPSRNVTEGVHNALHRVFYFAMGLSEEDIHRPFIAVVTASDDSIEGAPRLEEAARQVKAGVWSAQGIPREVRTISGGAGVAQQPTAGLWSMVTRELIADSAELVVRGHSYDGMVGIGATMSALAGLGMAAYRLDVPSVVIPVLPETRHATAFGDRVPAEAAFALALQAIGLAPRGSAGTADGGSDRVDWSDLGRTVMALVEERAHSRWTLVPELLAEAVRVLARVGAPAEAFLHLLSIASEAGVAADLLEFDAWVRDPNPGGSGPAGTSRVLTGALAPDAAIATNDTAASCVSGPARTFESAAEALAFLRRDTWSGEVVVVRGQGPHGRGGFPVLDLFASTDPSEWPQEPVAVVTDGLLPRRAGLLGVSAVGPDFADDGPIADVEDGDVITVDVGRGTLDVVRSPVTSERVLQQAVTAELPVVWKYRQTVGPARYGAVTHGGARAEIVAYRDL